MILVGPFGEIFKIVVIVRHLTQIEIFVEGLSKIKHLAIFPLVFLQISAIDDCQVGELSHTPLTDISVAQFLSNWIVSDVEVLDCRYASNLTDGEGDQNLIVLDGDGFELRKTIDFSEIGQFVFV